MTAEHNALKKNLTDKLKSCMTAGPGQGPSQPDTGKVCLSCEDGWEIHRGTCYYFSNIPADWEESRKDCQGKGGDLVKIENEQEQKFLEMKLRDKMAFDEDKFWIGLTDSKEESKWLWVDETPLDTRYTFWSGNEPDDFGPSPGEDCVRMGERGGSNLKCWFDSPCSMPQKSICEKQATILIW
ncbi:CD209 antigen-like protein 2 [Polymixia lowei]